MDECQQNNGGCDSKRKCTNTVGGHECGDCPVGWSNDGATECKGLYHPVNWPHDTAVACTCSCLNCNSRGEPVTFTVQSTSSLAYKAVQGKGCTSYIHMDHKVFGKNGGDYSLEECAAAVKKLDGLLGCKGNFFFFENAGYCNCPTDGCNTTPNNKAGGPGQLYEFTAGT